MRNSQYVELKVSNFDSMPHTEWQRGKMSSSAYLSNVQGSSLAYLTGVWGERDVKINLIFVYFSLHKHRLGVSMFIGHCLDFRPSSQKIL